MALSTSSIHSKLPETGASIFSVMSALAQEHSAVNLSQGFPDFEVDESLRKKLSEAALSGWHQYVPMPGMPVLREETAKMVSVNVERNVSPDEITITAGATQAIFTAIGALVSPGDEVIVFTPAYDCYIPAVRVFGGVVRHCPLNPESFSPNWELLAQLLNAKTRLIIINTPHNPTGSVLTLSDLQILSDLIADYDTLVISDEVYDHVSFLPSGHASALQIDALRERTLVMGSFGKIFHITGWKIGYVVAPPALTNEFRKVHQFNVFSVNAAAQQALAAHLSDSTSYTGVSDMYKAKRDQFAAMLAPSRFRLLPCNGTYFQLVDYSAISNQPDVEFARSLTIHHQLATIPVSVFSPEPSAGNYLRICFAKKQETLEKAARILCAI
jgi:methionine aminotransferase